MSALAPEELAELRLWCAAPFGTEDGEILGNALQLRTGAVSFLRVLETIDERDATIAELESAADDKWTAAWEELAALREVAEAAREMRPHIGGHLSSCHAVFVGSGCDCAIGRYRAALARYDALRAK